VVVLGGLMVVGVLVGQRRRDDYDHTMTRVQVAAQAAGDTIDIGAFQYAWSQEQVDAGAGARPAEALVPKLAGADIASYSLTGGPAVVVDYQIDEGGQQGCVRLVRTADGTTVRRADRVCAGAFLGAP
jgi:hypothetical protein